ncbi:Uncharacterised protein [uncultured archaeon]|nr:Uncharacterised protein [uncultured archaeon]
MQNLIVPVPTPVVVTSHIAVVLVTGPMVPMLVVLLVTSVIFCTTRLDSPLIAVVLVQFIVEMTLLAFPGPLLVIVELILNALFW